MQKHKFRRKESRVGARASDTASSDRVNSELEESDSNFFSATTEKCHISDDPLLPGLQQARQGKAHKMVRTADQEGEG